jgi:hypothetical protein
MDGFFLDFFPVTRSVSSSLTVLIANSLADFFLSIQPPHSYLFCCVLFGRYSEFFLPPHDFLYTLSTFLLSNLLHSSFSFSFSFSFSSLLHHHHSSFSYSPSLHLLFLVITPLAVPLPLLLSHHSVFIRLSGGALKLAAFEKLLTDYTNAMGTVVLVQRVR